MMDKAYENSTIEALILASPEPIPSRKLAQVLEEVTPAQIAKRVAELNTRYADTGTSFRIREMAGGYQFYILPEYVGFVEELFTRRRKMRLTRAALETVAIVAYRQPVTKTEIEHIRGVASDGVIHNLLEKKLITITGRADTVGKPLQYGTTDDFLKFFGLNRLADLPKMSEIEELIAANEPKSQTELRLERSDEGETLKLNVADGVFDPKSREEDEIDDEPAVVPVEDVEASDEATAPEDIAEEDAFEEESLVAEEDEFEDELATVGGSVVDDGEALNQISESPVEPGVKLVLKRSTPEAEEEMDQEVEVSQDSDVHAETLSPAPVEEE